MFQGTLYLGLLTLFMIFSIVGTCIGEENPNTSINGMYSIDTTPSGAELYVGERFLGLTPLLFLPDPSIRIPFSITIEKEGYLEGSVNVTKMPVTGGIYNLSTILIPSPRVGRIVVTAKPEGSLINLDNAKTVVVPFTFENITPGDHAITISKSGYKPYQNTIHVLPDSETTLEVVLISNVEKKELAVTTTPPDAEILVDGIFRGTTSKNLPLLIGPLTDGTHSVQARLAGYKDAKIDVTTQAFLSTNLAISLVSYNNAPMPAVLRVRTIPPGADIFLSGIWAGQTPQNGFFELNDMPPNRYKINLVLSGYQNYTEWISPSPGETVLIDKKLDKV